MLLSILYYESFIIFICYNLFDNQWSFLAHNFDIFWKKLVQFTLRFNRSIKLASFKFRGSLLQISHDD